MIRRVISWHQVSPALSATELWRGLAMQDAADDARRIVKGGTLKSIEFIDRPSAAVLSKLGYPLELDGMGMDVRFTLVMMKEPDDGT